MAARVSSHLWGLMTAVMSFTGPPGERAGVGAWSDHAGPVVPQDGTGPAARRGAGPDTRQGSDGGRVTVAGADPHHRVDRADPDLAVADSSGLRGLDHDADHVLGVAVVDDDLDADLRDQRDVVLGTAVDLGV